MSPLQTSILQTTFTVMAEMGHNELDDSALSSAIEKVVRKIFLEERASSRPCRRCKRCSATKIDLERNILYLNELCAKLAEDAKIISRALIIGQNDYQQLYSHYKKTKKALTEENSKFKEVISNNWNEIRVRAFEEQSLLKKYHAVQEELSLTQSQVSSLKNSVKLLKAKTEFKISRLEGKGKERYSFKLTHFQLTTIHRITLKKRHQYLQAKVKHLINK